MESNWRWNPEVIGVGGWGEWFSSAVFEVVLCARLIPPYPLGAGAGDYLCKCVRPDGQWFVAFARPWPDTHVSFTIWIDPLIGNFPYQFAVLPD